MVMFTDDWDSSSRLLKVWISSI